ncbi:MAG: hypothetical protein UV10_C0007G0015 [Candidatus Azambacteria bacterium GW2011_GWA1_42_19]|uniref:Uncharacterized protein n=1 Tax=Candidatus Azambacteria bacterium GW2011_GWA1_42_19 TaxID=1618609 RepID=A0A0G0ZBY6_9BACT|nr:MAG: hypothetical protein UV10_C0007G0015 [Candidatus Azambacteria bacterium GW2011_GWA1_42_19]
MCNKHKLERSARVCECGMFVPATEDRKIRRVSVPFKQQPEFSANIWPGVSRRPVWTPDGSDDGTYPLGVFDYTRVDSVRPDYTNDPGGSFDNARRIREDGRP